MCQLFVEKIARVEFIIKPSGIFTYGLGNVLWMWFFWFYSILVESGVEFTEESNHVICTWFVNKLS